MGQLSWKNPSKLENVWYLPPLKRVKRTPAPPSQFPSNQTSLFQGPWGWPGNLTVKGLLCFRAEEPFLGVFICKYKGGVAQWTTCFKCNLKMLKASAGSLYHVWTVFKPITHFLGYGKRTHISHTAQKIILRIKIRQWLLKKSTLA